MTQQWIISALNNVWNTFNKSSDCRERGGKKKSNSWHKHEPKNLLTETKSTYITVKSLFTEAREHTSTFHSSQLTPIYPRAFKNGSENRGSETESPEHRLLVRIKGIPWVGGKEASDSPQCSAAKWNNANQALIATSLACSSQLAAITLSVNSPTKGHTIRNQLYGGFVGGNRKVFVNPGRRKKHLEKETTGWISLI